MMKVLVTGASGQLGQELTACANIVPNIKLIGLTRQQLDVTNAEQVMAVVKRHEPDVIIHAAAYTAVDQAEMEQDLAYEVNALGTRYVAEAAEAIRAKCCMISTDYVLDGQKTTSYVENDPTNPINWYGHTKRAGERLIEQIMTRFFIVRTSWVYGPYGHNFMKTMLRLGGKQPLQVVADQFGSPTYTADLASFVLKLIQTDKYGTYHATNAGSCSWYEFAEAIFTESELAVDLTACSTATYKTAAKRPANSVLHSGAMLQNGFEPFRHWREGLKACLQRMKSEGP